MSLTVESQKRGVIVGLILCAVGAAMFYAPIFLKLKFESKTFALVFFGVLLLISGLVTFFMFLIRMQTLSKILSGKKILAVWDMTDSYGNKSDIVIAEGGLCYDNELYTNNGFGCYLLKVELEENSLVFTYSTKGRWGRHHHVVNIPISEEKIQEAEYIVQALSQK